MTVCTRPLIFKISYIVLHMIFSALALLPCLQVNVTIMLILSYYLVIQMSYLMYEAVSCWNMLG